LSYTRRRAHQAASGRRAARFPSVTVDQDGGQDDEEQGPVASLRSRVPALAAITQPPLAEH
jgi:hypothetical protein